MIRIAEQLEFMKVRAVTIYAKESRVIVEVFYKITSKTKIYDISR